MRTTTIESRLGGQAAPILALVQQAGRIREPAALLDWLTGPLQGVIPHRVAVAGWGDFHAGAIHHVVVGSPDQRIARAAAVRLLREAHAQWVAASSQPQVLPSALLLDEHEGMPGHALVHGMRDAGGGPESVYVFLVPSGTVVPQVREAARLLVPSIDVAFRQLAAGLPSAVPPQEDEPAEDTACGAACDASALSGREAEVMQWVRMGKTNAEIAIILNLSTFTVKNHMRRIYKKLNAMNRAQAVSRIGGRALS